MRKHTYSNPVDTAANAQLAPDAAANANPNGGLPNRLMTAFEVAEFVGCHEETVRRAYLRGLLVSQRFGVRGRRFHAHDVLDWIARRTDTRFVKPHLERSTRMKEVTWRSDGDAAERPARTAGGVSNICGST
jgi:excisionase family DNA binding protein